MPADDNELFIDIEHYRKLVRQFIDLRRYQTALFWAEKVIVLSNDDPVDVYWYAQCMFLMGEYHRAAFIIKSRGLEKKNLLCYYLIAECLLEAKEYQDALDILNSVVLDDLTCSMVNMSLHTESMTANAPVGEEHLRNDILASVYFLKGKIQEAMDNRTLAMDSYIFALQKSVYCTEALDALVNHEMLMCWEEQRLMESLAINQQCSEADAILLRTLYQSKLKKYYVTENPQNNIEKTPGGGSPFNIESLREFSDKFKSEQGINLNKDSKSCVGKSFLTPNLPTLMSPASKILNEIKNTPTFSTSLLKLSVMNETQFKSNESMVKSKTKSDCPTAISLPRSCESLHNSVDLLVAKAEQYFYNCEYNSCQKVLERVFKKDPYHSGGLTIQIGCLSELKAFNKLFYVAHKLVDLYPDQAISWYAVGCYYDLIRKSDPARRYLSKATSLDKLYGPAWLAYGHSFARENEHDQAMAAYFKATQLMRGCHLPLLYIGIECGLTKNLELAEKFFYQAMSIAPLDVFVLYELGVIKFESEAYECAEELFCTTLKMVESMAAKNGESISPKWEPLYNNLGHCCRKNRKYSQALSFHQQALVLKPQNAKTYTAIAFVQALSGALEDAIETCHKSLALRRDEIVTTTLLENVIKDLIADDSHMAESLDDEKSSPAHPAGGNPLMKLSHGVKLKFDDYDSNASHNSDTVDTNLDWSMDVFDT